jgi:hypothetical protein
MTAYRWLSVGAMASLMVLAGSDIRATESDYDRARNAVDADRRQLTACSIPPPPNTKPPSQAIALVEAIELRTQKVLK